jgi:two-component system chemotaxis response regulator CheY
MAYVFVVDDDPAIRTALRSALEEHGHVVFEAGDGVSALERLRASPWPLVVLLDFKLPRLDGAGVLGTVAGDRTLAQRHRYVLMTASAQTLPVALGALLTSLEVPLVQKPFELEGLLDLVAHLAQEALSTRPVSDGIGTAAIS